MADVTESHTFLEKAKFPIFSCFPGNCMSIQSQLPSLPSRASSSNQQPASHISHLHQSSIIHLPHQQHRTRRRNRFIASHPAEERAAILPRTSVLRPRAHTYTSTTGPHGLGVASRQRKRTSFAVFFVTHPKRVEDDLDRHRRSK